MASKLSSTINPSDSLKATRRRRLHFGGVATGRLLKLRRSRMGKHESGYARMERDFYPTPSWVTAELAGIIDVRGKLIWECACGGGRMSEALKAAGANVFSS